MNGLKVIMTDAPPKIFLEADLTFRGLKPEKPRSKRWIIKTSHQTGDFHWNFVARNFSIRHGNQNGCSLEHSVTFVCINKRRLPLLAKPESQVIRRYNECMYCTEIGSRTNHWQTLMPRADSKERNKELESTSPFIRSVSRPLPRYPPPIIILSTGARSPISTVWSSIRPFPWSVTG